MQQKSIKDKEYQSFEELHSCLEQLVELTDFEQIETIVTKYSYLLVEDQSNTERGFKLYSKILNAIKDSANQYPTLRNLLINGVGVMCDNFGLAKEALSLYLLGLLGSDGKREYLFYNNIGVSLADLEDYDYAKLFYQKALNSKSYPTPETKKTNRIYNLALTNLAIANAKLGDIHLAKNLLKDVDTSSSKIVFNYYKYSTWLINVASFGMDYKAAVLYIQQLEKNQTDLVFFHSYYLRKFLLDSLINIPLNDQYIILMECFELHNKVPDLSDKKETILELIGLSKKLGKKNDEVNLKNELFKISSSEINHNSNANRIIIEQYLLFFNNLSQSNQKIKHQNEELSKLTFLLSHNLKTPIRNISGFTRLTRKKLPNNINTETEDYFNQITRDCNELYRLLDSINEIVHLNNKTESSSNSDLPQLISNLEEHLNGSDSN